MWRLKEDKCIEGNADRIHKILLLSMPLEKIPNTTFMQSGLSEKSYELGISEIQNKPLVKP